MSARGLMTVGYLLVRPTDRQPFFSAELLPEQVVSASDCICPQFPDDYAIDWCSVPEDRRSQKLAAMGIAVDRQAAARRWATGAFEQEFGWSGTFYSPQAAADARQAFVAADVDVRVIGLALSDAALEAFLGHAAPRTTEGESGAFNV